MFNNIEEDIKAFEDFQRHARQERQEHNIERSQLRVRVLAMAEGECPAYMYALDTVTGEETIEPIFTAADQNLMRGIKVFV